ncbi:unnamed protein product [Rhodiola kirilowii]
MGCLCYGAAIRRGIDKFDARGRRSVLLGYPSGQKGYRLYDLQTKEIYHSRDVVFHEDQFPFEDTLEVSNPAASDCVFPNLSTDYETMEENPLMSIEQEMESQGVVDVPTTEVRRSMRPKQQPAKFSDYVMAAENLNGHSVLGEDYNISMAHVLSAFEPTTYSQAQGKPEWEQAMANELDALEKNKTWELTTLPAGYTAIGSKWVYKVKFKSDGSIERHKARLVVKGFNQKLGKDYKHTFSPVAKLHTVRIVLALATARGWPFFQLDINNAFHHGFIEEDISMKVPEGYSKASPHQVCKLKRSLYGLKQASRQWNHELSSFLVSLGYKQSINDYSLFTKAKGSTFTVLLVYVDDIILTGDDQEEMNVVKQALHDKFTIKDLGEARYFLGIEICRSHTGTFFSQKKYISDILKSTHMQDAKVAHFPLPTGLKLSVDVGDLMVDSEQYRRMIGRLLYLGLTRPDISYAVQHLSQFVAQPRQPHFMAAHHLLRYLKGTINKGLFYPVQSDLSVVGFSDADWGACLTTRRSLTGFCVFLGHSLVSWKTKKQATVSRSSAEAEYRSMAATTSELVWTSYILHDLRLQVSLSITLFCDNKAARQIAANPCFHERTKHLELDCHFTGEKVQSGFLQTAYIHTSLQLADVMTKPLGRAQHESLIFKLGLVDLPT